ncbi:MAG TPA: epoxide hydrolase [Terracidiphilus sp.]|nr:epoxide hydrolase [Terracidiphilus sp.]
MNKSMSIQIEPYVIHVEEDLLSDLQDRLARTRIPAYPTGGNWSAGTDPAYLSELLHFWRHSFDWRKREAALNKFPHFKTEIDGIQIHYIHQRGNGTNPSPLLLTHGYPDSFCRFVDLIPMLTDPESYGGGAEDSFDVIVPDLPGYGFSDPPPENGAIFRVGNMWDQLMTERLGYRRYGAHGGDWGSTVTEQLARDHSDTVAAIHLTDVPFGHIFQKPRDLSTAEERYFQKNEEWMKKEGAYALIQSTKPHSLAPALNDSPAGLAAWMLEKFRGWSDCDGNIESCFSKEQLLTHIMIYWATGSIGSSFLPYYDYANADALTWIKEGVKKLTGSSKVPAGFALFPKDISRPPREWAARFFNVQRWEEMPRGGHFAAMEAPELLAGELRTWFRPFR